MELSARNVPIKEFTYWCNGRRASALYSDQYWASKANEGTTTKVHYTQIDGLSGVNGPHRTYI